MHIAWERQIKGQFFFPSNLLLFLFSFCRALENSLEFICRLKQWRRMASKCFQPFGFFHGFHSLFGRVSTLRTYTFCSCWLKIPLHHADFSLLHCKIENSVYYNHNCCRPLKDTAMTNGRKWEKKQIMVISPGLWAAQHQKQDWELGWRGSDKEHSKMRGIVGLGALVSWITSKRNSVNPDTRESQSS